MTELKTIRELGMSEEQAVQEILFMRDFEKYLMAEIPGQYNMLAHEFAAQQSELFLREKFGADDETVSGLREYLEKGTEFDGVEQ